MKTFSLFTLLCLVALSSSAYSQTENAKFESLTKEFLSGYFKASPITATGMGVHDYDSLIDDISPLAQEVESKRLKSFRARLAAINQKKLSTNSSVDCRMLIENIDESIFYLDELKEYSWNPMNATRDVGNAIASLIYQEFAPLNERMTNTAARLRRLPVYIEQAKAQLHNPPKLYVETAVAQNQGNIAMIKEDVANNAARTTPEIQAAVKSASDAALASLESFGKWMQSDLLPTANRDTRIGKALFEKKLSFALKSRLTPADVFKRAIAEKNRVHREMYKAALPLYAEYYNESPKGVDSLTLIKKVLDKIVLDHATKEGVMDSIKGIIADLQKFVSEKDLLTLDPTQPIVIRETPEYERGVSVASMESPGPLEKNMKSFYNVTPIPNEWTTDQVESYLREYNNWSLRDLSIHEGVPGHYVQLYYSNRNPSILRSVFGSGPMVEGWAVYAERMTVDAGYMNNDPRMKLIMMKWYIRAVINSILDHQIHAGNMTQEQAMTLMTKEGFQEEREAAGKWKRANLTSAQLSTYFAGFQEIWDLREAYKKKMGSKYSLKTFNETFLSYGSPPVKYIRELMLGK